MKKYLIIPFLLLLFSGVSFSQTYLDYVKSNTKDADVIVEGYIKKKEAYQANNGEIYTQNHLSFERIIKGGNLVNDSIIIETSGGKVGDIESICFHCAKLGINEKGLFFIKAINGKFVLLNGNTGKIKKVNIDKDRQGVVLVSTKYVPDWSALISSVEQLVNGANITAGDLAPDKEEICFKIDSIKILNKKQISAKVFVKSDVPNLKFGGAEISIKYPTSSLGSYAVQNNILEATAGDFISDSNVYNVSASDVSGQEFKLNVGTDCNSSANYAVLGTNYQELIELILEVDISQINNILANSQITDAKGKYYDSVINDCSEFKAICLGGELFVAGCEMNSIEIIGDHGAGIGSKAIMRGENFGDTPGKVQLPDADTDTENGIVLENIDETLLFWSDTLIEFNITSTDVPGIMGSGKWRVDPSGAFNFTCSEEVNINYSVSKGTVIDIDSDSTLIEKSKPIRRYSLDTLQGAISFYLDNTINSNTALTNQGLTFAKIELLVKQVLCEWEDKTGISLNYLGAIAPALNTNSDDAKNVIYFADATTIQALSMGTHTGAFTTLFFIEGVGCTEYFEAIPFDISIRHPYSIDSRIAINQESNWYDKNSGTSINSNQHDLFTIILHEVGHSLGLNHALDPDNNNFDDTRAMYPEVEDNNDSKHTIDNGDLAGGKFIAQKSRELLQSPNLITVACVNDFALNDDKFCMTTSVADVYESKDIFKIIPNLCTINEEVLIQNELGHSTDFMVSNSLGMEINSFILTAKDTKIYKFPNKGIYFISAIVKGQLFTQKIIVQ